MAKNQEKIMHSLLFDVSEKEFRTRTLNLVAALKANQNFDSSELDALEKMSAQLEKKSRGLCNLKKLSSALFRIPLYNNVPLVGKRSAAPGVFKGSAFLLHPDFCWSIERTPGQGLPILVPRIREDLDPNPVS